MLNNDILLKIQIFGSHFIELRTEINILRGESHATFFR